MSYLVAPLPATTTSVLVSVIAEADSGLMARLAAIMARLEILPVQIHARRRRDGRPDVGASEERLEIDLYLDDEASDRHARLVALIGQMVGVERVMSSL